LSFFGIGQIDKEDYQKRYEMHKAAFDNNDKLMTRAVQRLQDAMLENKFDAVGKISLELEAIAMSTGEASGAMNEAKYYLDKDTMISRQEFERRSAQSQLDGEQLQTSRHHAGGKCEYVWNVWRQTGKNEALKQLRQFLDEKTKLTFEMGVKLGTYRENVHYIETYDAGVIALGGKRALSQVLPAEVVNVAPERGQQDHLESRRRGAGDTSGSGDTLDTGVNFGLAIVDRLQRRDKVIYRCGDYARCQ
jgi:hypothetical protein